MALMVRSLIRIQCWQCGKSKTQIIDAQLRKLLSDGRTKPSCSVCGSDNIDWDTTQSTKKLNIKTSDIHKDTKIISVRPGLERKR